MKPPRDLTHLPGGPHRPRRRGMPPGSPKPEAALVNLKRYQDEKLKAFYRAKRAAETETDPNNIAGIRKELDAALWGLEAAQRIVQSCLVRLTEFEDDDPGA